MTNPTEEPENKDTEQRLAAIEQLLTERANTNKKMMRATRVCAMVLVIMLVLAAVSFVLLATLYAPLKSTVDELPDLVEAVETLTRVTEEGVVEVMDELRSVDFDAINQTIEEVSHIKFDELNQSIQDLQEGVQSFKKFMEAFNIFG